MDRGARCAVVHGVAKSGTPLIYWVCTSLREVESTVQEMPKIKQVVRNKFTFRAPLVLSSVSCVELYVSRHQPIPLTLVAQRLKHLAGMQETRVRSLGWKDPLEKEMAIHSSTLAWRIPWREEPGRLQSMGSQRVEHD